MALQFQARLRRLSYASRMIRIASLVILTVAAGCGSEMYVRDGVTDGDTFYLADRAFADDDPVLQSWVTYSLARSACQLDVGGTNPARQSTYGCEFSARQLLLDSWQQHRDEDPALAHEYLDELLAVRRAGFLDEYVVHYFGRRKWQVPAEVDVRAFRQWRRKHLAGHRPQTHIIGSWNFAENVSGD